MSKKYHLKCPNCGNEFDFNYNEFSSLSDPNIPGLVFRYGPHSFSIKCPQCHKRNRYSVTDEDLVKE
ncbi:MAG: hypothetical protein QW258_04335 [Thermoplasmata archaeon]